MHTNRFNHNKLNVMNRTFFFMFQVSAFFAVLFFIADTLLYIFYWRMHKYTATLVNAENVPFSA